MSTIPTEHPVAPSSSLDLERVDTLVIGAGQAGLAVGYELARRGVRFLIVDASERVGDAWRLRWSSLRLFSPARYDALPGMPFPASARSFPTKDAMADYLEAYARHFDLPVRTGVRIERLTREDGRFVATSRGRRIEADRVVVAMSGYQAAKVPSFGANLAPGIVQLHSKAYRDPTQLAEGAVLVVGAGNSGAEIALELAASRPTWLAGESTGELPFSIASVWGRYVLAPLLLRFVFHRVLTGATPIGRAARPSFVSRGGPWIRLKARDLAAAGVRRVPRMTGVRGGAPLLADGGVLEVASVVWCTGFDANLGWIDLPVFDGSGQPRHRRGLVRDVPGLAFVGLPFLHAASSAMVHGVARDAVHVVRALHGRPAAAHGSAGSRAVSTRTAAADP